jgi:hypothetical protein
MTTLDEQEISLSLLHREEEREIDSTTPYHPAIAVGQKCKLDFELLSDKS